MEPLTYLALIWAAVFAAVVMAKKTRMTLVFYFLFMGCVLVNTGVLPDESGPFIRQFAELSIIIIMFALSLNLARHPWLAQIVLRLLWRPA